MSNPLNSQMFVVKRNGEREKVMFDKITLRISKLVQPSEDTIIDPTIIAMKVINSIYSGITTEELDLESAKICSNMVTINPIYGNLAGRILVSNLHKKTLNTFVEKMEIIQANTNLLDKEWLEWVIKNREAINNMMDYEKDYIFDFFGFKTLEKSYLIKNQDTGAIYERPQDMFMRVASYICMGDLDKIKITYDMLANKAYTHASPTLFNAGTWRPQLSSCFLLGTNDSLEGITTTWDRVAKISKWAGGIGLHISNIRAKGSIIKGTNAPSSGIVPMLRVYNDIARYINQGGKRKGSFAIYLEPHHADVLDFLELKRNIGDENERTRDLFLAMWLSDYFMEMVRDNGDWYLMCPTECPRLTDTYGDEYTQLYKKYVAEGKYKKVVKARHIMDKIMESQFESGVPYILFKDHINNKSNQKNIGTIKSSNLCVAFDTNIITKEYGIRPIGELNDETVEIWNGFEWSKVKICQTGVNQTMDMIEFSNGENIVCTPEHKFYIMTDYVKFNSTDVFKKTKKLDAKDLEINMKLMKCQFPVIDNNNNDFKYSYTHGLFCADGTYNMQDNNFEQCSYAKPSESDYCKRHVSFQNTEKYDEYIIDKTKCHGMKNLKTPLLYLYGEKMKLQQYVESRPNYAIRNNNSCNRIELTLPVDIEEKYIVPYNYSMDIKLRWLEGFVDGDGCITTESKYKTQSLQMSSIHIDFLKDIKKLIHTLGIDSKINLMHKADERLLPDGKGGMKNYKCQDTYRLIVSAYNLQKLIELGFSPKRLKINRKECNRSASEFIKVKNIIKNYTIGDTYCFTEPIKNLGVFNGIVTGQCAEIVEVSNNEEHAVCNLASISLNHHLVPFKSEKQWTIYTKENCKYCNWAKSYFKFKGFDYVEKTDDPEKKLEEYRSEPECLDGACRRGVITYPQIFYGETHIGGFTDMIQYTADEYDYHELWRTAYIATINLDHVIDKNYYPTPETKCSNFRNRPIGLGIQGLADTLVSMKIPFESDMALRFNRNAMETIYHAALSASKDIAKSRYEDMEHFITSNTDIPEYYDKDFHLEDKMLDTIYHHHRISRCELKLVSHYGAYSSYIGSPMWEGKMQHDMWCEEATVQDWDELREEIAIYGVRNSLVTALMPTASTSQIMGNNECFEWFTSNVYTRSTLAGEFPVVNKYLVNDLLAIGMWNDNMKQHIIAADGSVELLDIPPTYKELYKTMWDIKSSWVVKHARARAPFVDQTQSMNIYMAIPDDSKLIRTLMYAWEQGLKTGSYYVRTKPSGTIKFTVDAAIEKKVKDMNEEVCTSCSA